MLESRLWLSLPVVSKEEAWFVDRTVVRSLREIVINRPRESSAALNAGYFIINGVQEGMRIKHCTNDGIVPYYDLIVGTMENDLVSGHPVLEICSLLDAEWLGLDLEGDGR